MGKEPKGDDAPVTPDLNREDFFADIVSLLAENLEETVGLEDSASFIALVGGHVGRSISESYGGTGSSMNDAARAAEIARVCVDLKARLGGAFEVESIEDGKITFINSQCPFGSRILGKPSLCMMTTNVFGRVAADRNGYASVHIDEAIAAGDKACRVVVNLNRDDESDGHEFFG